MACDEKTQSAATAPKGTATKKPQLRGVGPNVEESERATSIPAVDIAALARRSGSDGGSLQKA